MSAAEEAAAARNQTSWRTCNDGHRPDRHVTLVIVAAVAAALLGLLVLLLKGP
jgi:hypothetical protein